MDQGETCFQLLYLSQLAPDRDFTAMKEIVAVARSRNASLGLTGALLFDGGRFCQLIEGSEVNARFLMTSIQRDPRHTGVKILLAARSTAGAVTQHWASGYCDAHELDALDALARSDGTSQSKAAHPPVLDAFMALLDRADIV